MKWSELLPPACKQGKGEATGWCAECGAGHLWEKEENKPNFSARSSAESCALLADITLKSACVVLEGNLNYSFFFVDPKAPGAWPLK